MLQELPMEKMKEGENQLLRPQDAFQSDMGTFSLGVALNECEPIEHANLTFNGNAASNPLAGYKACFCRTQPAGRFFPEWPREGYGSLSYIRGEWERPRCPCILLEDPHRPLFGVRVLMRQFCDGTVGTFLRLAQRWFAWF